MKRLIFNRSLSVFFALLAMLLLLLCNHWSEMPEYENAYILSFGVGVLSLYISFELNHFADKNAKSIFNNKKDQ